MPLLDSVGMEGTARLWPRLAFGSPIETAYPARARRIQDEACVLKDVVDESPGINLLLTITPQHCLFVESRRGL
jgi:hypothetical protein